jgi:hypothetical protein
MSWQKAIKGGFQPALYSYEEHNIPLGEVTAALRCKIWAQKIMAINCYFEDPVNARRFVLTVLCNKRGYFIGTSAINFASCPIGQLYQLHIIKNNRDKIELRFAKALTAE